MLSCCKDGQPIKKPISCSAPRYVDYLFTWVQNLLDDERIFPTEIGTPFPPDFMDQIRTIFKRLRHPPVAQAASRPHNRCLRPASGQPPASLRLLRAAVGLASVATLPRRDGRIRRTQVPRVRSHLLLPL